MLFISTFFFFEELKIGAINGIPLPNVSMRIAMENREGKNKIK